MAAKRIKGVPRKGRECYARLTMRPSGSSGRHSAAARGMVCNGLKGGMESARFRKLEDERWRIHGWNSCAMQLSAQKDKLRIAGFCRREIAGDDPYAGTYFVRGRPRLDSSSCCDGRAARRPQLKTPRAAGFAGARPATAASPATRSGDIFIAYSAPIPAEAAADRVRGSKNVCYDAWARFRCLR